MIAFLSPTVNRKYSKNPFNLLQFNYISEHGADVAISVGVAFFFELCYNYCIRKKRKLKRNDKDMYDEKNEGVRKRKPGKNKKIRIRWDRIFILTAVIVLAAMLVVLYKFFDSEDKEKPAGNPSVGSDSSETGTTPTTTTTAPTTTTTTTTTTTEPPPLYPVEADIQVIDGVTYINGVIIVNKTYGLPEGYEPGVDPVAYAALEEMYAAAAEDGLSLWTASGFRTEEYQRNLYEKYAARDGYDAADTYSARPRHSEHESGLAFDVNDPSSDFNDTEEAKWLYEHCAEYGFIIRYPKGKENITGFMYESWHVRYVGKELAQFIMEQGITLEEYFGITSKYADISGAVQ